MKLQTLHNSLYVTLLFGTAVPKPSFNDQSLKEVVVLKVNWTTPEAEDLLPPNHYLVQYRKVGKLPQNPWHTVNITGSPPPTTAYLEGLSANAPLGYWVRVIAVSTVGAARRWPMQQFRISGSEFDVLCEYSSACVI